MLINIMYAVIAVVVIILILAAMKPDNFQIERKATINAIPEKVFAILDDFHQWSAWSPWEKLDPGMTRSYSGTPAGKGTIYEWQGNKKVGKGRMEITDLSAPTKLQIKLDFFEPFEAHNTTIFTLDATGDTTHVTWTMTGPLPFVHKIMHVFMNMDKMVGKDFEEGLGNLKALAEQ